MIGILDIGTGNLQSVTNAVSQQGFDPEIVASPAGLARFTHLILPGVGAFSRAMQNFRERGFFEPVMEHARAGKPLLGICLGMQILASRGTEHGQVAGLDLIPGEVTRIPEELGLSIPHVGWNDIELARPHPVFAKVKSGVDFYFVHSYVFATRDPRDSLAYTNYGARFSSVVARENIVGVQFHPEKSQVNGLRILENFCSWDGKC